MAPQPTNKENLINRIMGILNGELPAKRVGICICWDEDPEQPEPGDLNVFLIDGRKCTYDDWKKYFSKLDKNE